MHIGSPAEKALVGSHALFDFLKRKEQGGVWGLDLEDEPHREVCEIIQDAEMNERTPFALIEIPRGCYKSSIARGTLVWKQLRRIFLYDDVYYRICLISATLALSRSSLRVIEGQLRNNPVLRDFYGDLWINSQKGMAGSKVLDGEGIVLAPRIEKGESAAIADPSFWIGSVMAAQTGRHADEAYVDDINDKKNTKTAHQRELTHELWSLLFPLIGSETGGQAKITFTCTAWHDDDVRGRIKREEKEKAAAEPGYETKWRMVSRSIYKEDGGSYFPRKYTLDAIANLRDQMSTREFSANYLNDPVGENGFVNEDEIVFRTRTAFPALRDMRISVDPNQHTEAKEAGCYAAITVGGYDRFANLFVLGARGSRDWSTKQLIDELFDVAEEYPNVPIFMEDSHMGHFDQAVRLEEAARSAMADGKRVHLRINYVPVDVKTSKYERWEKLQPRFRRRAVVFAEEIAPKLKVEIKEELIRGRAARFNDFLDSLAGLETGVRPRIAKDGAQAEVKPKDKTKARDLTYADVMPEFFS